MSFFPLVGDKLHLADHAMPLWFISYSIVFVILPTYLCEALRVPTVETQLATIIQFGYVNALIWMALAALAFFVKTAADKKK